MTAPIEAASREWRNGLIDVGGGNRLLNYRNNSSTLVLDDAPTGSVSKLLSGAEVRLAELFITPETLLKAQRACATLARKQREAVEEYGISVTYLAAGMASWDPDGNPEMVAAEAVELGVVAEAGEGADSALQPVRRPKFTRPRSPILLRPVEVELRRGTQQSWVVRLVDDFQLNGVLTHVINADRDRVDEDDILGSDNGDLASIPAMHGVIERECHDVADFSIEPTVVIGAFSYAKQPMVDDVSDMEALEESDIVAALAGDGLAAARVQAIADDTTEAQPDYQPVQAEFLVLDADASQSYVVNAALAGRNMVVEGPPGTGKSQTIANIIATSVAAGRTVLFVAQKRAAVSAVLDRLTAKDLNHLVLDLFAASSSRRFVADQLQAALDRQGSAGPANTDALHYSLESARGRLVRHNTAMHDPTRGWGISVFDLMQISMAIPGDVNSELRIPVAVLKQWTSMDPIRARDALSNLVQQGALNAGWSTARGWSPSKVTNEEELRASNDLLMDLNTRLPVVADSQARLAESVDLPAPQTWTDVATLAVQFAESERIRADIPEALNPSHSTQQIHLALGAINRAYRKSSGSAETGRARRESARLAKDITSHLPRKARSERLAAALSLRTSWVGRPDYLAPDGWRAVWETAEGYRNDLQRLNAFLRDLDLTLIGLGALPTELRALVADGRRRVMPSAHHFRAELDALGLGPFVEELEADSTVDQDRSERAIALLDRVITASLLDDALLFDADLATVTGDELDRATASFQIADQSHLDANTVRIRRIVAERLKSALDAHPDQHVLLKKEVTRKMKFTPVRRLLQNMPEVILAAKPVWAMSPLQVSRLLPRERVFDLVIFDEASQVKPADAIPAILRGGQLIVAGDSRQLPPTEFFTKTLEDPDEADDDADDVALDHPIDETPPPHNFGSLTRDAESILFAMDRLLAGQSRQLRWHYRSRDERLIAVSNSKVYDGSLFTFPAADTSGSIEHITVPFSKGISGGTNSPEAEVAEVVEAVRRHAALHPDESLGVIAFGIRHQHRLEAALDKLFADEPALFKQLNSKEPFFVKSIERVQGDERDAIILTVGYGKNVDGQLRLFWGPLLQAGGERRLNVAISRAKLRMTLISSFSVDDLSEDGHDSRGYKLMYHFVRFMASGGTNLDAGPNRMIPLNPFEIDVRNRLEAAGLKLDPQVGVGHYRLDFAVRHPTKPGRHVLAIEADGAAYHSGHTARERDRLRQQLLERRGWVFHRIWSTDWFNDANGQVAQAVAAFEAAVERADNQHDEERTDTTAAWELPVGVRQLPRPSFAAGYPIDEYPSATLAQIVLWVRSDSAVRSSEDEAAIIMKELGFQRRGTKIALRIREAQSIARGIV